MAVDGSSMSRIHILDKAVADRIAAGEVVERPASVVKELIENAIDAGARAIAIEIRQGGMALIRVSDNGSGMTREDAALAVERFATSKIATERDLHTVRTLGFRGEALPSIAAVAQLEMVTRTRAELEGTRVRVVDGKKEVEVAGAPVGTQVTVRDLFYNAPVRRKFLKSPLRESELVQKTVIQYALAFPQIAFRLVVDGKEILYTPAATPLERLGAVWGREVAAEMRAVEYSSMDLRVRGFVSPPTLARASREWQHFYVNGRPIRSGLLAVMLERPYAGRLPNRYPLAVIHLELDPQLVDVNVHPRKAEVRFFQERAIYGAVSQAVEQALRGLPITATPGESDWPFASAPETTFVSAREAQGEYRAGPWRALGQIHNTYLLAQTPDGLVIVDQHAAQEQIFFERLTSADQWQSDAARHFAPAILSVTPREAALLNAHLDAYRALGIEIEPFGENTFRVNALPEFSPSNAHEIISALLQEHERHRMLDRSALRDKLASKLACLCAVKAGDALDLAQQQALLDALLTLASPATCPHGRPTFVELKLEDLERRFLRR